VWHLLVDHQNWVLTKDSSPWLDKMRNEWIQTPRNTLGIWTRSIRCRKDQVGLPWSRGGVDSKGQPALDLQESSVMPNAPHMDGTLSKRSLGWCSHVGKLTHGGCLVFEKKGEARQDKEIFCYHNQLAINAEHSGPLPRTGTIQPKGAHRRPVDGNYTNPKEPGGYRQELAYDPRPSRKLRNAGDRSPSNRG
jgi:hypothetical protein